MVDEGTNHTQRARWRGLLAVTVAGTMGAMAFASPARAQGGVGADALPLGSMYHVVDQIGARALWERGITGKGVNVAVVDTGIANVPALQGADKVVAVVDLSSEAEIPEATFRDTYGHGTHMSGIIAGRDPGADPATAATHPEWFLGVAPDAGLVSVKVGDNTGAVDVSQVIAGIDWVTDHADDLDIRVLNLSFSSDSLHTYLTDPLTYAVERAWKAGIVVVIAAGNDGLGELRLGVPANDPRMIAVGGLRAVTGGYEVPAWATNGNGVRNPDIGAPGAHIDSLRSPGSRSDLEHPQAHVGNDLMRASGSSQAAAVTSGAVALLLQARPSLTPDQVKALLRRSADGSVVRRSDAVYAGEGLLRVDRAVKASASFASQLVVPALGTGSLDAARGSARMQIFGSPLTGEIDVLGNRWKGSSWRGDRWSKGTWDGVRWTGADWMGARWSHATWAGARWSGSTWSGVRWTDADWSGSTWSGSTWSGSTWSGSTWSGSTWSGSTWSGSTWSGSTWSGSTWSGSTWSSAGWQ